MALDFPSVIQNPVTYDLGNRGWNLYNPEVVSISKDLVSDYIGDYTLIQYDNDEYLLILFENFDIRSNGDYFVDGNIQIYDLYIQTLTPEQLGGSFVVPEKGSISGHLSGVDTEGGLISQDFSGTLSYYPNRTFVQLYKLDITRLDRLIYSNSSSTIIYSSIPGFAKLQSGEMHYSYMLSCIAVGACLFGLIRSIYKRLI